MYFYLISDLSVVPICREFFTIYMYYRFHLLSVLFKFYSYIVVLNIINDIKLLEQRYTCDQCGRSYKHKTNLCNHKREECGKPPSYFCPICRKGFKKKQHLQRHLTVHSDIDLTGYNIDREFLKNVLPQQILNNTDFKVPVNPAVALLKKEELPIASLPPMSIFPGQIIPYPPSVYSSQVLRPALMHSNNLTAKIAASVSSNETYNLTYAQSSNNPDSQPNHG